MELVLKCWVKPKESSFPYFNTSFYFPIRRTSNFNICHHKDSVVINLVSDFKNFKTLQWFWETLQNQWFQLTDVRFFKTPISYWKMEAFTYEVPISDLQNRYDKHHFDYKVLLVKQLDSLLKCMPAILNLMILEYTVVDFKLTIRNFSWLKSLKDHFGYHDV
jgi:hypothetical protein